MTFKKGYYLGLILGLIGVIALILYVNKMEESIENIETINLEELVLLDKNGDKEVVLK